LKGRFHKRSNASAGNKRERVSANLGEAKGTRKANRPSAIACEPVRNHATAHARRVLPTDDRRRNILRTLATRGVGVVASATATSRRRNKHPAPTRQRPDDGCRVLGKP